MKSLLIVLAVAALGSARSPLRFENYSVYRVTPWTNLQLANLRQLQETHLGYNFWTDVTTIGRNVDIMVPPHLRYDFEDYLALQRLNSTLSIENVQTLIDREQSAAARSNGAFNWKSYQRLEHIHDWLRSLEKKFPGVVTVVKGGQSYEGREILGIKISFKPGNKAAFLEGGIHAREWIGPATLTYIVNELLTSSDPAIRAVAESRDWYAFPSTNPDGYEYTHNTNRMWRKTRTPYGTCFGADPNRNWGYHWMDGGASTYPCLDTHAGSGPFSEVETKSLSEFINTIGDQLDAYIAFHSYSQLLLIPYGHAGHEVPANNKELHVIGNNAAKKLAERYGTQYRVGNIPEVIYVASGGSSDWAAHEHNIRLVYTYELRDTGSHGFLLPAEQIIPTAEETLDSFISIFQQADGVA